MTRLGQIAYDDFVSVRADDPAARAAELVAATNVRRVIVRRLNDGHVQYFLFPPDVLVERCRDAEGIDLETALGLNTQQAVPIEDADSNAEESPDVCVVHRDGEVIGYYDASLRVNEVRGLRAVRRSANAADAGQESEAVAVHYVHADIPERVTQNDTVSLLVTLRSETGGGTELPVAVADGMIDIIVLPEKGFVLEDRRERQLRVTDEKESLPIQFKLRATDLGIGRIKVVCLQGGTALGAVFVYPVVIPAGEDPGGQSAQATRLLAPPPAADADLVFLIQSRSEHDETYLEYVLKAADPEVGLHFRSFRSKGFQLAAQSYFQKFYSGLDQRLYSAGEVEARAHLSAFGSSLFEDLFPEDLRKLLWKLKDRIKTVQILSDEPWIPWELVQLSGQDDRGRVVEGSFLCEAFRLTRWLSDEPRRPELQLKKLALVAPENTGLGSASRERDFLINLAVPGGREVFQVPADYVSVRNELQKGVHDAWHFVGHAAANWDFPEESHLQLGPNEYLRTNDVSGPVRNCGRTAPLVFLSGCQTGQGAMGLTGAGGWATKFVKAGASAFIGTLWSVDDTPACAFAIAFYNSLLSGMDLAEAAFQARKAEGVGVTGLAYTVFADPFAKVC